MIEKIIDVIEIICGTIWVSSCFILLINAVALGGTVPSEECWWLPYYLLIPISFCIAAYIRSGKCSPNYPM